MRGEQTTGPSRYNPSFRYRCGPQGNLLLVGDAAHRFPPAGGFGLNTGVQDAHNLAWKLALVMRGLAGDELLDTYEVRRCVRRDIWVKIQTRVHVRVYVRACKDACKRLVPRDG